MTRDGSGGPMRTEDDLRQALATLERHAPSADTVLAGVRAAAGACAGPGARSGSVGGGHRQHIGGGAAPGWPWPWPRGRRPPDWWSPSCRAPRRHRTVSGPVQTELPHIAPGQVGLPTAASVGRAMLAAFQGVPDDIEYTIETGVTKGVTTSLYRLWSWPARRRRGGSRLNA